MLKLKFLLLFFEFKSHLKRLFSKGVFASQTEQQSFSGEAGLSLDLSAKSDYLVENKQKKKVFFVFRGLHFIDFFIPIHQALDKQFPGLYQIFYIDFSTTLKRVKQSSDLTAFKLEVKNRLATHGISSLCHLSIEDVQQIKDFPNPDIILTTEGIRHENFDCEDRVFLPHGCVVKERVIQKNIRYNHFFQTSKPPYTYKRFVEEGATPFSIHPVGYPKIHLKDKSHIKLFLDEKPVVIFAPSLDIKLLFGFIQQGILTIFRQMLILSLSFTHRLVQLGTISYI